MAQLTAKQEAEVKAYYMGRNSIGDGGEVWYKMEECPEINTPELQAEFKRGIRNIKAELRLNADTEWDD